MITISLPRAIELLNEAVEERGEDYIDGNAIGRGCTYVYDDKPGCIVGLVFHKAGVPMDTLKKLDTKGSLNCMGPSFIRNNYGVDIDSVAFELLARVQRRQDDGTPWGSAVNRSVDNLQAT